MGSVREERVWMLESSWEVWGRVLFSKGTQHNKMNKMSKKLPPVTTSCSLVCCPCAITVSVSFQNHTSSAAFNFIYFLNESMCCIIPRISFSANIPPFLLTRDSLKMIQIHFFLPRLWQTTTSIKKRPTDAAEMVKRFGWGQGRPLPPNETLIIEEEAERFRSKNTTHHI